MVLLLMMIPLTDTTTTVTAAVISTAVQGNLSQLIEIGVYGVDVSVPAHAMSGHVNARGKVHRKMLHPKHAPAVPKRSGRVMGSMDGREEPSLDNHEKVTTVTLAPIVGPHAVEIVLAWAPHF